jgi:acid phosphatase class B
MKKTVTFDFDHTLMFEVGGPNPEGVAKFREHAAAGDRVHVVTSRVTTLPQMVQEVHDFLKEHSLEAQSVKFTEGKDKLETLMEMGSELHFDDDDVEIEACQSAGIEAVLMFNEAKWAEFMEVINR